MENNMPQYNPAQNQIIDIEERQRILKDRLILISQNLIDLKEETEKEILNLKREYKKLNDEFDNFKRFIETISQEFNSFAKKDELDVLKKQAKIFNPKKFVTFEDLENLKKEKNIPK